jgi:RNA polymerase sigma-70 factor (ECF subfamily)
MRHDAGGGAPRLDEAALPEVLRQAFAGDVDALTKTIEYLTPIVHARTLRALLRNRRVVDARNARQELEDLAQDVLALCFANDAKILRMWDPARGMSFANFIGMVAEREAGHVLRSGRRTPWALVPTQDDALESILPHDERAEEALVAKDILDRTWTRLESELSPRGLVLLRRLVVDEQSPESVGVELGMSTDAVYSWKQRLVKRLRALVSELSAETASDAGASRPIPMRQDRR